jgi:hypothetical protein
MTAQGRVPRRHRPETRRQLLQKQAKPQLAEDEEPGFRQDVIHAPRRLDDPVRHVRGPTLSIVCEPCDRRGRYNVDKLMAEHGDAKRSFGIHDRCKAKFEGFSFRA